MARRLLAVSVLIVAVALPGCTYDRSEPGLFRSEAPRPPVPTSSPDPAVPKPNPSLPVAGEQLWTTGDGSQVRVRIAVHAVRRSAGATVLDWSVTPESAPGLQLGQAVPSSVQLGLETESGSTVRIALTDGDRVYRPLAHSSAAFVHHCLCTPLWLAQQSLRLGVTTLMQVAYPPLPEHTDFVDVVFATVPVVSHVSVTPVGQVPTARLAGVVPAPARSARPAGSVRFSYLDGSDQRLWIWVDRVVAGPVTTSLSWTIESLEDQRSVRLTPFGPPVNRTPPGPLVVNGNPTDAPSLRPDGRGPDVGAAWMTADIYGRAGFECLCTELGLWASAVWSSGGSAGVVTNYPALPAGTRRVDVVLPGVGTVRGVPVQSAPDAAAAVGTAKPAPLGYWADQPDLPRAAWTQQSWPTPLPDPDQLGDYVATVERITGPPPL